MELDSDKYNIGNFFILLEKLDKKTKIGYLYSSIAFLKEKRNKLYDRFCDRNTAGYFLERNTMSPEDYIELTLLTFSIEEIDSYVQKLDSYLDELLKV